MSSTVVAGPRSGWMSWWLTPLITTGTPLIKQGAVDQLDAPEPDPPRPHVEHCPVAVAQDDGDPVAPWALVVPRLDARHAQTIDHPMAGPGVGDGVLVAAITRHPAGHVDTPGRGERASAPTERIGDDDFDGQRSGIPGACVDTDVEVERSGRAVGLQARNCRRVSEGDPRHGHQLDAAMQAGHPPLVLVLDPRRRAPPRHDDAHRVRATAEVLADVVGRRQVAVGAEPDERPVDPHEAHRVRRADAEQRAATAPGRGHRELAPVDAGRVVGRDVRRLEGEGHPHVEVDRTPAVVAAVRRQDPAARYGDLVPAVRRCLGVDVGGLDLGGRRTEAELPLTVE